ncbi:MAG: DUF3800 domain-containing protein [Proteobacteria bacterium]|nr:DUF3800 domain-containing protein [Pseudomonadota bacterium]
MSEINIYCDESCHLPKDQKPIMAIGAIFCPLSSIKKVSKDIYHLKSKHKIGHDVEFKWLKVSKNKLPFYLDLIDYFFSQSDLSFRGLIVSDKSKLDHELFNQTHDDWYYKMYYQLIKPMIDKNNSYNIYLDIKDTRSEAKVKKLHEVLANSFHDFNYSLIRKVQSIRSHETNLMQMTDLLLGAISYANRNEGSSESKKNFINKVTSLSESNLKSTSFLNATKFNLFFWNPNSAGRAGKT